MVVSRGRPFDNRFATEETAQTLRRRERGCDHKPPDRLLANRQGQIEGTTLKRRLDEVAIQPRQARLHGDTPDPTRDVLNRAAHQGAVRNTQPAGCVAREANTAGRRAATDGAAVDDLRLVHRKRGKQDHELDSVGTRT